MKTDGVSERKGEVEASSEQRENESHDTGRIKRLGENWWGKRGETGWGRETEAAGGRKREGSSQKLELKQTESKKGMKGSVMAKRERNDRREGEAALCSLKIWRGSSDRVCVSCGACVFVCVCVFRANKGRHITSGSHLFMSARLYLSAITQKTSARGKSSPQCSTVMCACVLVCVCVFVDLSLGADSGSSLFWLPGETEAALYIMR